MGFTFPRLEAKTSGANSNRALDGRVAWDFAAQVAARALNFGWYRLSSRRHMFPTWRPLMTRSGSWCFHTLERNQLYVT
ncbi:MAG TPA: hypothetical protein ACFE0H_09925 [Elainellaceae cyanobacterium]